MAMRYFLKQSIIITILTIFAAQLSAQNDKLFLHNDSKIVGKLLHYKPGDSIHFELNNGEKIVFAEKDVKRIVMAEIKQAKEYRFREKGFYNATYVGFSFGKSKIPWSSQNQLKAGISLENITGYQLNRWIGAGVSIGYDNYYITGNDANVISVGSEVRGYLTKQNTALYYRIGGGVGFPMADTKDGLNLSGFKGGLMLHPAIGVRFGASPKMNFFIDLGTKFQQVHFNQIFEWSENRYTITYQRWILRGGLMF